MRWDPQGIICHFDQITNADPDAPAVWFEQNVLSYVQLQSSSQLLAKSLQDKGVSAGDVVAVCVRPGFDLLIALLATFRCGAVYLPLDPEHPEAHREKILEEALPRVLIMDDGKLQPISDLPPPWDRAPAYLMYTSGTTGQPKGVIISGDNLHFYLQSARSAFGFVKTDIFCNVARATFSISLFDLLLPLTVGASIRLLNRADIFDFAQLQKALQQSTVLHAGPSLLATLFRYLRTNSQTIDQLRHVSSGGDLVQPTVMKGMLEFFPRAEIFVIYGTTEISCMGTFLPIPRDRSFERTFVGQPFPGVELRLINEEICFAGPGIGVGYLHQAELTSDRFSLIDGRRFYRTGDYGRLHADGTLEMIGRRDFQVQLRGIRIELTGIENCVLALGLASHCAVVHRRVDEDSGFLLAFLAGSVTEDTAYVRQQLGKHLPAEMVPSRIIYMPTLPTTFNGKLDRRRLMNWPMNEALRRPAMSDLEQVIAGVMSSSLGFQLSGAQNFFEAGGHSLLAILVMSELSEKHAIVIPPAEFFQAPTPQQLAQYWEKQKSKETNTLPCHTLPLNANVDEQAIFMVAGAPIYRSLAQALGQNWSAIAIISEQECHPSRPQKAGSMEELARDYAQSILQKQRSGPYYLLGYSFAGILAFEIARQLTAAGHEVKRLFLLDATLPENAFRLRHFLLRTLRFLRTPPVQLWFYFLRKFNRRPAWVDPRIAPFEKDRGHRNSTFARDYVTRMPRYAGEAVLFVAGERLKQQPLRSRSCGWRPYISQLKVITTRSSHLSLVEDQACLQEIIREIHACAE